MDKLVGFARKKRLGDLLVDAGVISQDQLVKALQVQKFPFRCCLILRSP